MSTTKMDKTKKSSKLVILRLSPELLSRFEDKSPTKESKSPSSVASSPAAVTNDTPTLKVTESADNASESNSTPAPAQDASTTTDPPPKKRKGPMPGYKRSLNLTVDGLPKPRGKPGPKKKPRLEDGTIDHSAKAGTGVTTGGAAGHKLGPKANQGAINAGLRALDRSGKPCRKWDRKPFQLKSFTGIVWEIPSWKGTQKPIMLNGDDSSDTKEISHQSSSDIKPTESDTAMDSNVGDPPDLMVMSTPAASSPPPMPAPSVTIAAQG